MNPLNNKDIVKWILCDEKYINMSNNKYKYKNIEKNDGNLWNKTYFGSIKYTIQWTTLFSENLTKYILKQTGKKIYKPKNINGLKPDIETDDAIYEVKCRSYTIEGTIGEKIFGCLFKYRNVPILYKKPLFIILCGYQEYEAKYKFKINDDDVKHHLKSFNESNIYFLFLSDLYKSIIIKTD
jgi:hypothetical protein